MYSQYRPHWASTLFTPAEHAVLSHWLGVPNLCREPTPPTFAEAVRDAGFPEAPDFPEGSAAVASILVSRIQDSLPQFSHPAGDGLVMARTLRSVPIRRALLPTPAFLFQIDWALTAPGLSWPCAYHCTYVPEYHRQVVTCSFDNDEACGVADLALGAFHPERDLVAGALAIIQESWTADRDRFDQERWEAFLSAGLVSRETASQIADIIWSEEDPDWEDEL